MATVMGNVLKFFESLGVFDVLLPFILVFSIMFAILEKTKILGLEKVGKEEYTRKNLNAMVAFVMAFLVVASSGLVSAIVKVSSEIVLLFMLLAFFMALVGTMYTGAELEEKKGPLIDANWRLGFMIFVAISILFIFLDAIQTEAGDTWLEVFWDWLGGFYTDTFVAAIVLIILVIATMVIVTRANK